MKSVLPFSLRGLFCFQKKRQLSVASGNGSESQSLRVSLRFRWDGPIGAGPAESGHHPEDCELYRPKGSASLAWPFVLWFAGQSLLHSPNPASVVKTRLLGQSRLITSMWCSGRSHGVVQTARVSVSQIWVPTLLFAQRVTSGNWLSSLDHIHMSSVSQSLFMCVLLESRSAEACIRLLCLPGLISSLAVPSLFWGGWWGC